MILQEEEIGADGMLTNPQDEMDHSIYFKEHPDGRKLPSAVMIDSEPDTIDEYCGQGILKNLFRDNTVTGTGDASNCYARGLHRCYQQQKGEALNVIRREVEQVGSVSTFTMFCANSGGTGSGFKTGLVNSLADCYPHVKFINQAIIPSKHGNDGCTSPYNTLLDLAATNDFFAAKFIHDNESLIRCIKPVTKDGISYANLNTIISLIPSTLTASGRFDGTMIESQMGINLVPFPRANTIACAFVPLLRRTSKMPITLPFLLGEAFLNKYETCGIDTFSKGSYVSCCLIYRGTQQIPHNLHIKVKKQNSFTDWCPSMFKHSACSKESLLSFNYGASDKDEIFKNPNLSLLKLSNHTEVADCLLNHLVEKCSRLLKRRFFVHWYTDEGMHEEEFENAVNTVKDVIDFYKETFNNSIHQQL